MFVCRCCFIDGLPRCHSSVITFLMKIGDLVRRVRQRQRIGVIIRNLKYDRFEVFFFDTNSQYNMDKRLLEVMNESR